MMDSSPLSAASRVPQRGSRLADEHGRSFSADDARIEAPRNQRTCTEETSVESNADAVPTRVEL